MLKAELVRVLSGFAVCLPFVRLHQHLSLVQFFLKLFPYVSSPSSPDYRDRHLAMVMIGALTSAQIHAAIRMLGFDDSRPDLEVEQGRKVLRRFQLACLDQIGKFYDGCLSKLLP